MGWLFDLFVAPEVTPAEIADMDIRVVEQQVAELREPGIAEGMSNAEIAEAIMIMAEAQE